MGTQHYCLLGLRGSLRVTCHTMNLVSPLLGTSDVVQACWVLLSELPNYAMCCWQWDKRLLAEDTGKEAGTAAQTPTAPLNAPRQVCCPSIRSQPTLAG